MSGAPVLNLTQLHLDRLPGIDASFSVSAEPGINLIIGPNEAGKSSLVRSVFGLLWPAEPVITPSSVRGVFSDEAGPLQARRDDNDPVTWTRSGDDCPAPELPGDHVAHCYHLGLLDLNRRQAGDLDQRLAREIRTQMAGGFDLAQPSQDRISAVQKQFGIYQPIDYSKIDAKQVDPNMLSAVKKNTMVKGKSYAVPHVYGTSGLVVNRAKAPNAKDYKDLLDPQYSGRVSYRVRRPILMAMGYSLGYDPFCHNCH